MNGTDGVPQWLKDILDTGRGIFNDIANRDNDKALIDIARDQLRIQQANAAPAGGAGGSGGLLGGISEQTLIVVGLIVIAGVIMLRR